MQREVGCLLASDPRKPRRTFSGTPFVESAAMNEDYDKISREAMARANAISEISIFWGMIITVLVVVAGMIRGMVG